MELIFRHENNVLVNHAKNILENENIKVVLKNEHASTGMHPQFMYLELWVQNDEDIEKAQALINTMESNVNGEEWSCEKCNETNDGSFEICWNCGAEST